MFNRSSLWIFIWEVVIDLFHWEVVILFYWVDNVGFSPGPRTLGGGDPAYAHTGQMENP